MIFHGAFGKELLTANRFKCWGLPRSKPMLVIQMPQHESSTNVNVHSQCSSFGNKHAFSITQNTAVYPLTVLACPGILREKGEDVYPWWWIWKVYFLFKCQPIPSPCVFQKCLWHFGSIPRYSSCYSKMVEIKVLLISLELCQFSSEEDLVSECFVEPRSDTRTAGTVGAG